MICIGLKTPPLRVIWENPEDSIESKGRSFANSIACEANWEVKAVTPTV
jgi:hypothetical protein